MEKRVKAQSDGEVTVGGNRGDLKRLYIVY
jgi:hypothetical protein